MQPYGKHIEAVVKILAEITLGDIFNKILVGCSQYPHIYRPYSFSPDSHQLLVFYDSQERGLQFQRHFPDLIEEDGASVGYLEFSRIPPSLGSGKGSFIIAEEFTSNKLAGDRCTVNDHVWAVSSFAVVMYRLGEYVFAGSTLTEQKNI